MAIVTLEELQLETRDGSVAIFDTTPGPNSVAMTRPRDPLDPEPANAERGQDGLYDGFTGAGYLDMGGNVGDAFSFVIDAPEAGPYTFTFRYASPTNRPMSLMLDGQPAGQLAFGATGGFSTWVDATVVLDLHAGSNTVRLANLTNNGPNFDRVVVTHVPPADTTADAGGDLTLAAIASANPSAVVFQVQGLDNDIQSTTISINGGPAQAVAIDAQGRFTADLSAFAGLVNVSLVVQDEVPNSAQASTVVPIDDRPSLVQFFDGVDFSNLNPGSTIIRVLGDPSTHETNSTYDSNRDGLNDNFDGTSYVDFGGGIGNKVSLTVTVEADGTYDFDIRFANGSATQLRPIQISANGETVQIADTRTANLATWTNTLVQLDLHAGANTVVFRQTTSAGGPNIDSVRVSPHFDSDYALISGSGRIELENTDDHARIVAYDEVEFYFRVSASGLYGLDLAANAGALPGSSVSYYLTDPDGVRTFIDTKGFPGQGAAGEVTAWTVLQAGTDYKLTVESAAPGADDLDYLDVRSVGNAAADIAIQSRDAAFFSDRLQFSWLENPVALDEAPREYKDTAVVRISNTGTSPLQILDAHLSDHYSIVTSNVIGSSIAAGGFRDITVAFDGETDAPNSFPAVPKRTVYQGTLELVTNDAEDPISTVKLAAIWQSQAENQNEPNVNEIFRTFGFGTQVSIPGLNHFGIYEKVNDLEVLSPRWRLADGVTEAQVVQLAAYHQPGGGPVTIHNPSAQGTSVALFNGQSIWSHSILPLKNGGGFAASTITHTKIPDAWPGDDYFDIGIAGYSTNPAFNPKGSVIVPGVQQGHFLRAFQALDGDGHVLPNAYLFAQDFAGINYDYNDNVIVIQGITPVDSLV